MLLNAIINLLIIGAVIYSIGSWAEEFRNSKPYRLLSAVYEPILRGIRGVIPPIGGIDVSPAVLIFLLGLLKAVLRP